MIISIAAISKNWAIGKQNGLLFKLPLDLKHFKATTEGHIVVMGYNTLLSLPKSQPLPNRTTVVLCPEGIEPEGCIVYHDFDKMMTDLQLLARYQDVFICGGQMLYNTTVNLCDKCIITKVEAEDPEATAFFPNLDNNENFECVFETEPIIDNGYSTKICDYINRAKRQAIK